VRYPPGPDLVGYARVWVWAGLDLTCLDLFLFLLPLFCAQLEGLPAMVQAVRSDDPAVQLEATTQFRKLLSIGEIWIVVGAADTCLGCMSH
jgi:hypothetical protein